MWKPTIEKYLSMDWMYILERITIEEKELLIDQVVHFIFP